MTLKQLRKKLRVICADPSDPEHNHAIADALLLEYINDKIVQKIWKSIKMWYA